MDPQLKAEDDGPRLTFNPAQISSRFHYIGDSLPSFPIPLDTVLLQFLNIFTSDAPKRISSHVCGMPRQNCEVPERIDVELIVDDRADA